MVCPCLVKTFLDYQYLLPLVTAYLVLINLYVLLADFDPFSFRIISLDSQNSYGICTVIGSAPMCF